MTDGEVRTRGTPPFGVVVPAENETPVDHRVLSGLQCTWWGAPGEAPAGRCPGCNSPTLMHQSAASFLDFIRKVAAMRELGPPDDVAKLATWCRGRCFRHRGVAEMAWTYFREGQRSALSDARSSLVDQMVGRGGLVSTDAVLRALNELWGAV